MVEVESVLANRKAGKPAAKVEGHVLMITGLGECKG